MLLRLVVVVLFTSFVAGCSGERDRNQYRDHDRPQVGEKEKSEGAPAKK